MTAAAWFAAGAATTLAAVFATVWWGIRVAGSADVDAECAAERAYVDRLFHPSTLPRALP